MNIDKLALGLVYTVMLFSSVANVQGFVLEDNQHLDVVSSYLNGVLWDFSTAEVLESGFITNVYVNDSAGLTVSEYRYGTHGHSIDYVYAFGNSSIDLLAGHISVLNAYDRSSIGIYGGAIGGLASGSLSAFDNSFVEISAGEIAGIEAYDTTQITMTGGVIDGDLSTFAESILNWSGGTVTGNLKAGSSSNVLIGNGSVVGSLEAFGDTQVTITGGEVLSYINVHDESSVDISGGDLSGINVYNNSLVTISNGTPLTWVNAQDSATVNIMEGNITELDVSENGVIYLSNGYIGELILSDNSKVAVSGGYIGVLKSRHNSECVIYGYDFRVSGGVSIDGNEVVGTGVLTGKWFDGTSWIIGINQNDTTSTIILVSESTSTPDLTGDGVINLDDFSIFAQWWLYDCGVFNDWCEGVDFGLSGSVDLDDLMSFAAYWMDGWVAVPDVVGLSQAEAELSIVGAGLVVGATSEEYSDTVESGHIISQRPYEGQIVLPGTEVNIIVSLGQMAIVPSVMGMPQVNAEAAIIEAGLVVGTITEAFSDTITEGHIINQNPLGGEEVKMETKVNLVVSGPKPGIAWVTIDDPGFAGQMSMLETTNTQFAEYLNAALASNDIWVDGNYVKGNQGTYQDLSYYRMNGPGSTSAGYAINGGKSRINYTGGIFIVDSGFENHPVTYVSWYGATAFASYYGWRLPSEWEWQAVASFNDGRTYATGNSLYDSKKFLANYVANGHDAIAPNNLPYHPWIVHGTSEVGHFGTFGYGLADMAGNVQEWTSSFNGSTYRVTRGGSWGLYAEYCEVLHRNVMTVPSMTSIALGFRVCR